MSSVLNEIENVRIDSSGRFKYILIKLKHKNEEKFLVRGFQWAAYHADILDDFEEKIKGKYDDLKVSCVGGGRILHQPDKKEILVYGYSQGFGQPDHQISVDLLKEQYKDYNSITFSNDGY